MIIQVLTSWDFFYKIWFWDGIDGKHPCILETLVMGSSSCNFADENQSELILFLRDSQASPSLLLEKAFAPVCVSVSTAVPPQMLRTPKSLWLFRQLDPVDSKARGKTGYSIIVKYTTKHIPGIYANGCRRSAVSTLCNISIQIVASAAFWRNYAHWMSCVLQ